MIYGVPMAVYVLFCHQIMHNDLWAVGEGRHTTVTYFPTHDSLKTPRATTLKLNSGVVLGKWEMAPRTPVIYYGSKEKENGWSGSQCT